MSTPASNDGPRPVPGGILPSRGFSLASLALVVTVFAVLLACADLRRTREQIDWLLEHGTWQELATIVAAAVIGGVIGLIRMFVSGFSWRMLFLAPLIGAISAEVGLMILFAPGSLAQTLLGVAVVIGITILLRVGAE